MSIKRKLIQLHLIGITLILAAVGRAQPVTHIAAGQSFSLFTKADGSLWAMGDNDYGQLGDGTFNTTNRPVLVVSNGVDTVAAGAFHALFLKDDGSLWGMGLQYFGALGDGPHDRYFMTTNLHTLGTNHPVQIIASDVTTITAGGSHSLFLKSDGSMWGMGYNAHGELGQGTTNFISYLPVLIESSNVTAIAGGGFHSLYLKNDGSLWAVGYNSDGELGDGTTNQTQVPKQIVASNVTAIAAGYVHSLFLKTDGSLWGMGGNSCGQLGDGTTNNSLVPQQIVASNVTAVAAGKVSSLFLMKDGSLWGMGSNSVNGFVKPENPATDSYLFSTNRPTLIGDSDTAMIVSGDFHSLLLKRDGSLWAAGDNALGQLGDGTTNLAVQAVQIVAISPGYNHISAQPLRNGALQLSFVGIAGKNYALDRSLSLTLPDWTPQATNQANNAGELNFTNQPIPAANNFWRIRSVP